MTKRSAARNEFREWIDKQPNPGWDLLPLTHIAKSLTARDIIATGRIEPRHCDTLGAELIYCFYGRAAYRVAADGTIKQESLSPFCFIFDPSLIERAKEIHAFDTGAHGNRLFSHIIADEFTVDDYSLDRELERPNKLIGATFGTREAYFDGDLAAIPDPGTISEPWEFQTKAYLLLITYPGRNELDDRVYSIEVNFGDPIELSKNLIGVIVPHTLWGQKGNAPWLEKLAISGVEILPYPFFPARGVDYYQAQIESVLKKYLSLRGAL